MTLYLLNLHTRNLKKQKKKQQNRNDALMVQSDHPNKPHHNETLKKITFMKRLLLLLAAAATMLATGCAKDDTNPTPPPAQGNDLSAAGNANCYMVHRAGDYSFDATVMGNGVSTEAFSATRLAPAAAELLWQDSPALLSDIRLEQGRVHFSVGEQQGNAVVAVRDGSGKILWSWHIW